MDWPGPSRPDGVTAWVCERAEPPRVGVHRRDAPGHTVRAAAEPGEHVRRVVAGLQQQAQPERSRPVPAALATAHGGAARLDVEVPGGDGDHLLRVQLRQHGRGEQQLLHARRGAVLVGAAATEHGPVSRSATSQEVAVTRAARAPGRPTSPAVANAGPRSARSSAGTGGGVGRGGRDAFGAGRRGHGTTGAAVAGAVGSDGVGGTAAAGTVRQEVNKTAVAVIVSSRVFIAHQPRRIILMARCPEACKRDKPAAFPMRARDPSEQPT